MIWMKILMSFGESFHDFDDPRMVSAPKSIPRGSPLGARLAATMEETNGILMILQGVRVGSFRDDFARSYQDFG